MPIVSYQIHNRINRRDGSKKLIATAVDSFGKIWNVRRRVPPGVSELVIIQAWIDNFDSWVSDREKKRVKVFISEGGSPADIDSDYLNNQQLARAVIRGAMSVEDPLTVMPTAEYIDANITDTQLTNWFNASKAAKIRARVNDLIANKTFLEADRAAVDDQV